MKVLLLLFSISLSLATAQTSKELLRDGLFAEESEGDLKTATEKYEALLKAFEKERKVAAVALFRLASVKRKEGDEKAALTLYEDFVKKFGDIEPQVSLVKENYLALSGKVLSIGTTPLSREEMKLAELQSQKETSPDLIATGEDFSHAASEGWTRVVQFYPDQGLDPNTDRALIRAVRSGNLGMTKQLLDAGADPNKDNLRDPLLEAITSHYWKIAELLIERGVKSQALPALLANKFTENIEVSRLQFLKIHGANPD